MCDHGDTVPVAVVIPARLSATGRARVAIKPVDRCVAPIVEALNVGGILTEGSCCGHGKAAGKIPLQDGRWLIVAGPELAWWQRLGWAAHGAPRQTESATASASAGPAHGAVMRDRVRMRLRGVSIRHMSPSYGLGYLGGIGLGRGWRRGWARAGVGAIAQHARTDRVVYSGRPG